MPPSGLTLTEFWYYYVGPTLGYISPILDNDCTVLHCFPMDHWSLNILSTLTFHFFANDRGYVTKKIIYMTSSIHFLQY